MNPGQSPAVAGQPLLYDWEWEWPWELEWTRIGYMHTILRMCCVGTYLDQHAQ